MNLKLNKIALKFFKQNILFIVSKFQTQKFMVSPTFPRISPKLRITLRIN